MRKNMAEVCNREGLFTSLFYRKQKEKERRAKVLTCPSRAQPQDPLPPTRPHLLKFPPLPESTTCWGPAFNT
jgi:hypothetical protein